MHFNSGLTGSCQGISQTDAGVAETPRIDDYTSRLGGFLLQTVDERALVVGLEYRNLAVALGGVGHDAFVNLRQRHATIDTGLTLPQRIQIGTVKNQYMQPRV